MPTRPFQLVLERCVVEIPAFRNAIETVVDASLESSRPSIHSFRRLSISNYMTHTLRVEEQLHGQPPSPLWLDSPGMRIATMDRFSPRTNKRNGMRPTKVQKRNSNTFFSILRSSVTVKESVNDDLSTHSMESLFF